MTTMRQKITYHGTLVLTIIALFLIPTSHIAFADDAVNQTTSATTNSTVVTESVTQTTISTELKSNICQNCRCSKDTGVLECRNKPLEPKTFSFEQWEALVASGFNVQSVVVISSALREVTRFPPMNITILDLSHNEIETIEKSCFKNLSSLEVLDLSHNRLKTESLTPDIFIGHYAPDVYDPLKKLRTLRLGANELHSLNQDLFESLPALEELSLELNPFKVIDRQTEIAIASIDRLVSLDLSYMELEEIPIHLFHTPRGLRYLNLTGNLLEYVPPALAYATGLTWLSLDENPIGSVVMGAEFPSLKKLTFLSLSYMSQLKVIGRGAFSGLEALQEIHITNNPHLSYLHARAFMRNDTDNPERIDWPPVKRLYLHNNNLSYIDAQLLVQWDSMEVIDVRVNPWACDCSNRWLLLTLLPIIERTTPAILNNIDCNSPPQMKGLSMVDLEHKQTHMRCPDGAGNNPANDGALLMGLLIGVLLAIPLTAAVWCVYKRGCFGLFGQTSPASYSRAFYSRTTLNEEF